MSVLGVAEFPEAQQLRSVMEEVDKPFELHGDNLDAMELFFFCQTQWRVGGMGTRTGLDYCAVIAVMREHGMKRADREDTLWRVRIIEAAVLTEWKRQQDQERSRHGR